VTVTAAYTKNLTVPAGGSCDAKAGSKVRLLAKHGDSLTSSHPPASWPAFRALGLRPAEARRAEPLARAVHGRLGRTVD
jgi:hypothetical protein